MNELSKILFFVRLPYAFRICLDYYSLQNEPYPLPVRLCYTPPGVVYFLGLAQGFIVFVNQFHFQFHYILVANISNLMQVSVKQNQITFSWSVSGEYDSQKVLFKKVGGDLLHKTIGKTTSNDYRETIKLLEPCTKYKITVAAFNKCKSRREDIFITTWPRGK